MESGLFSSSSSLLACASCLHSIFSVEFRKYSGSVLWATFLQFSGLNMILNIILGFVCILHADLLIVMEYFKYFSTFTKFK